eukprot:scaffold91395_cov30-Attheya_sp.AAC.1
MGWGAIMGIAYIRAFGTRVVQLVCRVVSCRVVSYRGGSFSFFWISLVLYLDDSEGREATELHIRAPLGGGGEQRSPSEFRIYFHLVPVLFSLPVSAARRWVGLGAPQQRYLSIIWLAAAAADWFDENGPNCSLSIRLVQGVPTLVS